jgi:Lar family restriction alleviation protein
MGRRSKADIELDAIWENSDRYYERIAMSQLSQVELLPCPFCGGEADIFAPYSDWHVQCMSCGATGPSKVYKNRAIDRWNTRKGTI